MNELIITHRLDIDSNMDMLAETIKKDIDTKYNLVVTDDSLPETKKMMAAINKEKTEFKSTYKAFKDKLLEPLTPLDKKAKEIESYFDDARTALENQVKKFEAGKLARAKEVCIEYAMTQCHEKGIDFNAVTISDLFTKLGSVTATGNISGAAKSEIDTRIQAVENAILKARLEAEEKAKRYREIAEEARKKAEAEAKERETALLAKAEREKADAVERAKQEVREEVRQEVKQETPKQVANDITPFDDAPQDSEIIKYVAFDSEIKEQPKPVLTDDGKRVFKVSFYFEVKSAANADHEKLKELVSKMMLTETGKENLKNVEVN